MCPFYAMHKHSQNIDLFRAMCLYFDVDSLQAK